ncbi:Lrp/AsnC family transcriptional regulator [Pseudomonas fluorescens]|uniref:Lrp/AsnC family transcriptional regulator n=1 Tax=Pseudomonas sp. BF61 TaxID=2741068 RepID=UPI000EA85D29|nr:Lrp/AsnC family transcriptional regulator [Pseudomonas sp. BF61]AYG08016.1 Lrp/AsnC family transcriptional regulator [Pseudomonas fluorescens]MBU4627919.1 Lrp/AsnC family transcriptional regulator [Pseudomonas sp. BF61]
MVSSIVDTDEKRHFPLDETDLACLIALQANPRGTWRDLSACCDVAERTLSRRLQRLMDSGYIRVIGELDPVVVGSGPVLHAWIRVADGRQREVAEHLTQLAQTQVVMATTGEFDIFTEINLPSVEALSDMVVRALPLVPGVKQVQSQVVLRSFRRASRWRIDGSVPTEPLRAGPVSLNADEMRLLDALMLEGRASLGVLAETCGVSEPKAQRMLSGLVDSSALTFRVELEPLLVGYGVEAILSLQTRPGAAEGIALELAKDEHTRCLFGTSGSSQLFWHVLCRDIHDLWTVSTARMGALEGIISCETNTVVRAYKRAGRVRRGLMVE